MLFKLTFGAREEKESSRSSYQMLISLGERGEKGRGWGRRFYWREAIEASKKGIGAKRRRSRSKKREKFPNKKKDRQRL